ncbi:MAG: hypothetical protein E7627_07740 [Ruminococcaceae bacterium]|nr:hypothetical protein [Oscillospiraceae bacterium]
MKKIISLILVAVIISAFATVMFAADQTYTISGKITTQNPLVAATLTLKQGEETKYTSQVGPAEGEGEITQTFELSGVAPGTYDLVVTKAGHLGYTVTGVVVSRGNIDLTTNEDPLIAEMKLCAGDINGDECIDIKDLTLLTSDNTYNLTADTAVTKNADINGDGAYDVKDLIILTSDDNYSKAPTTVAYVHEEEPYVYKRVVLLGVDGCGAFFKNTNTPNMDRIFADGAITYNMQAEDPSISAPCWGAMLHGVTYAVHGITNDIAASKPFPNPSLYPSVFKMIHQAYPDAKLASFCNWNPINIGLIEDGLGVYKATAGNDALVTEKILNYLDYNDPKLLFVQFDQCDGAGHSTGYGSETHLKQLTITDGYIGQIYDKLAELGRLEDTLFIVTGDHGGTPQGSHGGSTSAEMNITFAAAGQSVQAGGKPSSKNESGTISSMQIRDIASVVLYALGVEQPETWTSTLPCYLFDGVDGWVRPKEKIVYQYAHRTHENEPTPKLGSGEYLTDFIEKSKIASYLTLDDNTKDTMGRSTSERGEISYKTGFYGEAADFSNGCVEITGIKPDKNSFSIALWFKTGGVSSDPCLVSNKNWQNGSNPGFVLSLRGGDVKFNAGNGSSRMDVENALPRDYKDGWVHVVLVVDRTTNTVKFCYDFGALQSSSIPTNLKSSSFKGISGIMVGQDGTGEYNPLTSTVIDEVIVFNGALTQDDVTALAKYYGVK